MVSKKREDPFTPDPKRGVQTKKMKEYMSPVPKTPLRNVMTPERNGNVVHSSSKKPAAEISGLLGSTSRSRLATSIEALNDDEQEKLLKREEKAQQKRDRKTRLMSPVVGSSPKAAPPQTLSGTKAIQRSTSGNALGNTPIASLIASEVAAKPLLSSGKPKMTAEQMNKVFEEWIKIASDNKINSKNTWNLALIDYFSELTFLRDGASINFQKASCTLDGCVKIYSSRVDSVVDETGKLMNGLAEGNLKNNRYLTSELGADQIQENHEEEDEDGEEDGKKKQAKKTSRHVNTLEKSAEALRLKQFDLEYQADPLFKKTCAEFDESNSRGMLLHNLSLSSTGQVIFDSSDSIKIDQQNAASANDATIDISMIKSKFGSMLASVNERKVCSAFADYNLAGGKNDRLVEDQLSKAMDRLAKVTIQPVVEQQASFAQQPTQTSMDVDGQVFDAPNPSGNDDFAPAMDDDYGAFNYDDEDHPAFQEHSSDGEEGRIGDDFVTEETQGHGFSQNNSKNMFSYFDDSIMQSWAGPNHWRVRRSTFIRPNNSESSGRTALKKKDFSLEFDESAEVDIEALFAKPANASTITLTKSLIEERSLKDNLLPEDMHFSSVNFLRLFTKPTWRFGSSTHSRVLPLRPDVSRHAEAEEVSQQPAVHEEFWARNEAHPEGVADATPLFGKNVSVFHSAQFLDPDMNPDPLDGINFDNDYGGYDDGSDGDDMPMTQDFVNTQMSTTTNLGLDLVALKAGVQIQRLAFSRVAKRVDVHKLKQAIWEEIEEPTKGQPAKKFSDLVQSLDRTSYPKEGLRDVSVPYCFICLLHLANEQGLTIQNDGGDLVVKSC